MNQNSQKKQVCSYFPSNYVCLFQSLHRQSEPNQAKIAQAKEELEEAEQKAEQSTDAYTAEMFSLIVKEADVANFILQYVQLQSVYHKSVLDTLSDIVIQLQRQIGKQYTLLTGLRLSLPCTKF